MTITTNLMALIRIGRTWWITLCVSTARTSRNTWQYPLLCSKLFILKPMSCQINNTILAIILFEIWTYLSDFFHCNDINTRVETLVLKGSWVKCENHYREICFINYHFESNKQCKSVHNEEDIMYLQQNIKKYNCSVLCCFGSQYFLARRRCFKEMSISA